MKHVFVILAAFFLTLLFSCEKEGQCVENIDPACVCTALYKPVCGCNDITYSNACVAQCSGITDFTEGVCP